MASPVARGGRRRRVLNQEAPGASAISFSTFATAEADAPRYGEQASVEHHPQVTDFVPRKMRTMMLTLAVGIGTAAGAEALAHFADEIAARTPGVSAEALSGRVAAGAVAWASAVELLLAAMLAKVIFSLRRHRVDDYHGRYRVWRWMVWGCVLASANAVVGAQTVIAKAAAAATGFSFTASASEWWLAPAAIVGAWIFVRLILEVAECKMALTAVLLAAVCYGAAAVGTLGFSPSLGGWGDAVARIAPLVGHTFGLVGLMFFGRYVVLDVQGLIEHASRPAAPGKPKKKKKAERIAETSESKATVEMKSHQSREEAHDADRSEEDSDEDEDGGAVRRLSKADRKRLRKQNRAA